MTYKDTHRAIRLPRELLNEIDSVAEEEKRKTPQQVEFILMDWLRNRRFEKYRIKEKK